MKDKHFNLSGHSPARLSLNSTDAMYLKSKQAYHKFRPALYKSLAKVVFKQNNDHEYINIVIGDWTYRFIQILIERESNLKKFIFDDQKFFDQSFLSKSSFYIPQSSKESLFLCSDSEKYNEQIYASICGSKYKNLSSHNDHFYSIRMNLNKIFSILLNKFKRSIKSFFHRKQYKNILNKKLLVLIPELKGWDQNFNENDYDILYHLTIENIDSVNWDKRKKIQNYLQENIDSNDKFQLMLSEIIVDYMPIDYIESYESICNQVTQLANQACPHSIVTLPIWRFSCSLAIFLGRLRAQYSTKLLVLQHGGGYGLIKNDPHLECELDIADLFYTWGWSASNCKTKAMPSPLISKQIIDQGKNQRFVRSKIFFPINLLPRHRTDFSSNVSPEIISDQFRQKETFFNTLSESLQKNLIFKKYHHDHGWEHVSRINSFSSNFSKPSENFSDILNETRILVSDSNQTSYLVSMGLNIPTVIYFEFDFRGRINDEAKELFSKLEDVKILHRSAEDAGNFLNLIYDNTETWWQDTKVQNVINEFSRTFCFNEKNFQDIWKHELNLLD